MPQAGHRTHWLKYQTNYITTTRGTYSFERIWGINHRTIRTRHIKDVEGPVEWISYLVLAPKEKPDGVQFTELTCPMQTRLFKEPEKLSQLWEKSKQSSGEQLSSAKSIWTAPTSNFQSQKKAVLSQLLEL